jgi:hypothetical protein
LRNDASNIIIHHLCGRYTRTIKNERYLRENNA